MDGALEVPAQGGKANISCSITSVFYFSLLRPNKLPSPLNTHAPGAEVLLTYVHTHIHMSPFAYLRLGMCTYSSAGIDALEHTHLMTACTGKWWGPQGSCVSSGVQK